MGGEATGGDDVELEQGAAAAVGIGGGDRDQPGTGRVGGASKHAARGMHRPPCGQGGGGEIRWIAAGGELPRLGAAMLQQDSLGSG